MPEIRFETERLIARDWTLDDAEAAFKIYSDPAVTQFIGGKPEVDLDSMRAKLAFLIERNKSFPVGMASWPVFTKENRQLIGNAMCKPLPDTAGNLTADIEIGWHLRQDQWGKGFATEFGRKLVEIAFEELQLEKIVAVVDPPNIASKRVAERLGMQFLRQTTQYYQGQRIDVYGLNKTVK